MSRILAADLGGPAFHKAHELGSYALAAATPAAVLSSKGSTIETLADWTFAFAIPVHTHISMNAVVTDYVPKAFRGPARFGVLGMSVITYLGIMKVNLSGPGLTSTIKTLWRKPESSAA